MPLLRTVLAALAVAFLLAPVVHAANTGAGHESAPREKDLSRAEKIITKLQKLEAAATEGSFGPYKSVAEKLYPGLFSEVAALGESDLKTDLTTAVFLYDAAFRAWPALASSEAVCDRELRDLYQRLCRENVTNTRLALTRAKARTHTLWAAALIGHARGERDRDTLSFISEMRAERENDAMLAASAVAALRALERDANAYPSLAAFEEECKVARVSYKQFSENVSEAFRAIDGVINALPRGRIRQQIENARNSYRDGLFWWSKTHRRTELTVAAHALAERDPVENERLDAAAVNYTVVINWRNASRYTTHAEELLRSAVAERVALR